MGCKRVAVSNVSASDPLSLRQQLAYVMPSISIVFLTGPMGIIQGIYAKHFGVTLAVIASVVLIARLFDVITDPLIGYFSDKAARTGSRKPFIVWGALLLLISSYFLFIPVSPEQVDADTQVSSLYFALSFLGLYLGYTLYEIPHQSWGAVLSPTPEGRNTIFGLRSAAITSGLLLFYAVPLLPMFESRAFTPETLQWSVLISAVLLLPTLFFCIKNTPDRCVVQLNITKQSGQSHLEGKRPYEEVSTAKISQRRLLISMMLGNKSLLLFYAASALYGLSMGAFYGLEFIFIDAYLGRGEDYALINICGTVAGLISLIAWRKVVSILGKKITYMVGKAILILSCLMLASLTPNETSFWDLLWPQLLFFIGIASEGLVAYSLLSDLVDYSTWKYHREYTGTYFSLYTFIYKCFPPMTAALGMVVVGWYGFDPAAPAYSADIAFGMHLVIGWIPTACLLLAMVLVMLIPLSRHHSEIIHQRLTTRMARANRVKQQYPDTDSNIGRAVLPNI